jgi:hypothetical protein
MKVDVQIYWTTYARGIVGMFVCVLPCNTNLLVHCESVASLKIMGHRH